MSQENPSAASSEPVNKEELIAAMFANMVMQHTNMAAVFLGLAPNPQTGETRQELDHARYFIDQLEMLQVKTKGNLNKQEDALLNQSLASLRMAFVQAVQNPPATPVAEPAPVTEDEAKKKFTKKY